VHSLAQPLFEHALAEYLRHNEPAIVEANFYRVELGEDEAALRYEDGVLVEIVPPGSRRLYWREPRVQRFESIAVDEGYEVAMALAARLAQPALRGRAVGGLVGMLQVQVPAGQVGVLKVDGAVVRLLQPGPAAFWRFNREISVDLVDTRLTALEVSGQEILTRDKVALRINLAANWRFLDVLVAFEKLAKPVEHLYRELQFGLRAAVGTRTLDELLERKEVIDQVVSAHLQGQLADFGIEVVSVGVKDIILPGEMKTLLAGVVEAEKAAQANVIRRREETAATRSLLNTAKVMEDNPVALRLKELETLERIAERIDHISVVGGLDQVLHGLVRLAPDSRQSA
jgi:regulator of protease activity HflC (stomatin/prohibitin superfamily)